MAQRSVVEANYISNVKYVEKARKKTTPESHYYKANSQSPGDIRSFISFVCIKPSWFS